MSPKKQIVWFEEVGKNDVGLVGGKGANLGEMINADLPVPYGFIVTSHAYFDFIKLAKLEHKIKDFLSIVNYENSHELQQASDHIRSLINQVEIPNSLVNIIISHYEQLKSREEKLNKENLNLFKQSAETLKYLYKEPTVAVRSSATAEDLPAASFAGQQETYLNVQGDSLLINKVRDCWASLFTPRAIYYRHQQGFQHFKLGLAVVVQLMVQSEKSGIAFSVDPVTNDKTKIVIEAIYGLGEYIVGGKVTPDHYEVDKRSFVLLKKEIKLQSIKLIKSGRKNLEVKLHLSLGKQQKLTDEEIVMVAMLVKDIEKHYFFPQDIEWAIENQRVYIVQSRPITTLNQNKLGKETSTQISKVPAKLNFTNISHLIPLVTGSPASPGIGIGAVKIIFSPKEIDKIKHRDVLVAPQTNPDYVPAMKKAIAIVTDKGGRTSHAAIVSRELGIPAVVGTENATKILKNEMVVTVNGATGEIYKGNQQSVVGSQLKSKKLTTENRKLNTLTKVYVNLAEPEQAYKIARLHVDGVGLLRAEFMIAEIGTHPKEFIREKKSQLFINRLSKDLLTFVKAFSPRPVIYRATDFKTNEYRNLKGGQHYEPHEDNPMIGFRGAYRYIANPDVFLLELEAIKKIIRQGYQNLHLMIPFVRVPWELIRIKEIIKKSGLDSLPGFQLLIMVEVPSCALNLEEFIKIGIDGVSIGTNDLTMMLLGVDRDNEEVAQIYDERHPVVVNVLKNIVMTCTKYGISSSICGQAASDYPDLVEELVKAGITSVSVNSDAIERTRESVYNIERKLYKKK